MNVQRILTASLLCVAFAALACEPKGPQPSGRITAGASTANEPTFNYDHQVRAVDMSALRAKYVVAVARAGDNKPVNTPFGQEDPVRVDVKGADGSTATAKVAAPPPAAGLNMVNRDQIVSELAGAGCFTVIERQNVNDIVRELDFTESKYVDKSTAPQIGKLQGVKYIIDGSSVLNAEAFRPRIITPGNWMGYRGFPETGRNNMPVIFRLRMYSVETGEIVAAGDGYGRDGQEALKYAVKALASVVRSTAQPKE